MYLLGIDLGTTGCKSMVFDKCGTILSSNYIEYDLIITPEGIEQDAHEWWNNVSNTVRACLSKGNIKGEDISALSVSSQGIAFVPVDYNGTPLHNAISWLDGRSVQEVKIIEECIGLEYLFYHTGKNINPCYVLPQLMWIKKYKPDVYQKTYKVLMAHDYIVYKLTGRMVTDISMASGTLAYDIHEKRWMTDLLDRFDIDINKFPELTVMGKVVGNILPGVAKELGLSTETKVVAGAQDQRCASLGAGIDKGIFTVSLGTASAICAIIDKPIIDENMQVTCCGLDDNHWILETVIATAGVALKWLKNTFFTNLSYQEMDSLALKAEPLSGGVAFYPHLSIGASGKAKGTFTGLSLQTKPEDIIRAVLEGIAFQMKIHISDMERMGVQGNEVRIFGGGANSPVWCQIIADILNKKVVVPRTHETANLGAAIIAKMGLEGSLNFHSGYSLIGDIDKEYQPDADKAELYMKAFAEYDENNSKI